MEFTGQEHRIGVAAAEDAVAMVVAMRLGLAGYEPVRQPDAAAGMVAIGGNGRDALSWHPEPDAGPTLEDIVVTAAQRWPGAVPASRFDSGPMELRVADVIAALGRLRPDMKVLLETPVGTLGICSVAGRVVSAGLEGESLRASPAVTRDPSLALVLELAASQEVRTPLERLHGELSLVCEYAELFARSRGFGEHLVGIFGDSLSLPVGTVRAEPHEPSEHGVAIFDLLWQSLARLSPDARSALVPIGPLDAGGGLPRWLRGTLPVQRFGRLFFALEGVPLAEAIAASHIDPLEAEAATALASLAGAITSSAPRGRPRDFTRAPRAPRGPSAATATVPIDAPADVATEHPAEASLALAAEPPPLPPACGAPPQFFEILRRAADDDRRTGRRRRLGGTRFEPNGDRLEDLLLFFRIGAGATGDVFLGVQGGDGGFQKTVAVKRLADSHDGEGRWQNSFLAEARFAASLEHPNLVQIFRLVESQGRHHIVMEFVHGASVAQIIAALTRAQTPCPEAIVRWVGGEAARGLHYMHERPDGARAGLIHRDVAPPNILLAFDGSVRVIDMSIAQPRDDHDLTRSKTVSGRLGYSSPETLAGVHASPSSDLFGLAATLYELLVGTPCFIRGTPHTTLDAIASGKYTPILKARPEVSPRLAYAIERGLSIKPEARFKDMAAFREALLRDASEPDPAGRSEGLLQSLFGGVRERERDAIECMRRSAAEVFAARPGTAVAR